MNSTCLRTVLTTCIILFATGTGLTSETPTAGLQRNESLFRFTYDRLDLPQGEQMGLAGGNYLVALQPWLHAGLGIYGAVDGQRGGFFTGGVETGVSKQLPAGFSLQGGLFLGGGGGGSAPQGGGFMVRPHGELLYDTGYGAIGVGVSHVRFPNGSISSTQASFIYQHSLETITGGGWLDRQAAAHAADALERERLLKPDRWEASLLAATYFPAHGIKDTAGNRGDDPISIMGVELRQFYDQGLFLKLSGAGAVAGSADGFAQILAGGGWRLPLAADSAITTSLSVGAAGGGKVDTGGGFVVAADAGLRHWLLERWSLGISGGYILAQDGGFRAATVGMDIAYGLEPLRKSTGQPVWNPAWWQIRGGGQSYLSTGRIRKNGNDHDAVDLLAVKIDRFVTENLYLTGQTLGAVNGGAGGYAAGLVGVGWLKPLWPDAPLHVSAEMLIGAGGGGNVDSGGGFLLQPMAGLGWMFTRQLGITLSGGMVTAPDGRLSTPVADLALIYRFTTLEQH